VGEQVAHEKHPAATIVRINEGRQNMSAPMPRYFFDIVDAKGVQRDEEGQTFPDAEAAGDEALIALLDIAREEMPSRQGASLRIEIRNDKDGSIARKTLNLEQDVIEDS
jgi:hypothetical protein